MYPCMGIARGGRDRWFRAGRSSASDPRSAGREAATLAQGGERPKLLVVFSSASYDPQRVVEGVCSVTPDEVLVAGGTSMGELAGDGPTPGRDNSRPPEESAIEGHEALGPSVVVAALGGEGIHVAAKAVPRASAGRRDAGVDAAAVVDQVSGDHKVMLMIVDGLTREQHEVVRGAYSVLGASVPIVGGCSADDLQYTETFQFYGSGAGVECLVDSVVSVGITSTGPFGVGIGHGWYKHGEPMVVTRSEGGEVFLIDNEPALDVYLGSVGADRCVVDDEDKFQEVAFNHPLGLSRGNSEDIRVVHSGDKDRGSLLCLADVPQGALVWTMETDARSLIDAAARSCRMAVEGLGGTEPVGMLVFDCGARKVKLGRENLGAEQAAVAETLGVGVPFAGFYTYGEIARTKGSRGMHHLTVASLAIG